MPEPEKTEEPQSEAQKAPTPVLDTQVLFQGQKEVWIEHDGVRYRLRITRRNKLILQK